MAQTHPSSPADWDWRRREGSVFFTVFFVVTCIFPVQVCVSLHLPPLSLCDRLLSLGVGGNHKFSSSPPPPFLTCVNFCSFLFATWVWSQALQKVSDGALARHPSSLPFLRCSGPWVANWSRTEIIPSRCEVPACLCQWVWSTRTKSPRKQPGSSLGAGINFQILFRLKL